MSQTPDQPDSLQIDIVSDVMCPWCIVGFRQLEEALATTGTQAALRWHPFELNPNMPAGGQNLAEHMAEKYGASPAQSLENRKSLQKLGADLGFAFNFTDHSRILNTFLAHQLLDWAATQDKQHALKMALFTAYFTDGLDVSDLGVLVQIASTVGLNARAAEDALQSGAQAQPVREKQSFWTSRGISGVPSMIFGGKYLLTGAQGTQTYTDVLRQLHDETRAA
ncbi:DsbA family oxidoreductase [Roseobacter sp. YSTF-M11]|uniref:DsbA family oxidoreductase n=1 Tax=Roseobacter insulae TaxID=2859783 RepID=A0A9X1K575_9RHOB|nr:DsbA family oxidoreductase [Roseobacter insulae]MBW4710487.1 DsbA family oxidoreductase [Roseobacter insulae]